MPEASYQTRFGSLARYEKGGVQNIADELSRQYFLGYPAPSGKDGKYHTIRVETRDQAYRVRARRGYYAN